MPTDEMTTMRRTLELLWRRGEPTRPGPKPTLTVDGIVQKAIEIADREGVAALAMRRVAVELGVGTASLYTYVPGRAELIALMLDAVAGDDPEPHTIAGDWRERVLSWARADWEGFHRHPWVLQVVTGRIVPGPGLLRWYDSALRVFADTGLSERDKISVIETVNGYVRGLAWASVPEAGSGRADPEAELAWQRRRTETMAEFVDLSELPALTRVFQAGVEPMSASTFESGMERILDGIQALIDARGVEGTREAEDTRGAEQSPDDSGGQ